MNTTTSRPKPSSHPPRNEGAPASKRSSRTGWWIAGAAVVVVAIAAIVAVTGGDSGSASTAGRQQTRAVEISGGSLVSFPDSGPDQAIGKPAPTIFGQSFDGSKVIVEPNKATMYVLLAHWCPHCQREVPQLVRWMADGKVPAGLQVIGISTSATSERPNYPPSSWLEREQFPWPVIADDTANSAASAMGLTGFPYFVLVGADGNVLLRQSGEVDTGVLTEEIMAALSAR